MADIRIKVAKDKAEFLKSLRATEETHGPFQSYADVLIFAAALGIRRGRRVPIAEYSKSIDPIRQDIFYGKGYDQVINLLAITSRNEPRVLASTDEAEEERIKIFEEYANAGLEDLKDILNGTMNKVEQLLLYLNNSRLCSDFKSSEEFDLNLFL